MIAPQSTRLAAASVLLLMLTGCAATPDTTEQSAASSPPSLAGFNDAIHHWKNAKGATYPRYEATQIREIADNILLLQRDHGGWIQNQDPQRILTAPEKAELIAKKAAPSGSFDNRNVYTQITYLMGVYEAVGDAHHLNGARDGLNYLLEHQIESCGGWPHSVPARTSYHPMITVADEVFSGPLTLLRQISINAAPFQNIGTDARTRATAALALGEECLLSLQVRQGNKFSGWAGQYTPDTLAPAQGRSFELASIATEETVYILNYLMTIKDPSAEVKAAVHEGAAWLERVAIEDTRLEFYELEEPVRFKFHTATHDRRLVPDANAPRLWARLYDVTDNSVILANRDSKRVLDYQDITQERRTGYHWYGTWANQFLDTDYPNWQARLERDE